MWLTHVNVVHPTRSFQCNDGRVHRGSASPVRAWQPDISMPWFECLSQGGPDRVTNQRAVCHAVDPTVRDRSTRMLPKWLVRSLQQPPSLALQPLGQTELQEFGARGLVAHDPCVGTFRSQLPEEHERAPLIDVVLNPNSAAYPESAHEGLDQAVVEELAGAARLCDAVALGVRPDHLHPGDGAALDVEELVEERRVRRRHPGDNRQGVVLVEPLDVSPDCILGAELLGRVRFHEGGSEPRAVAASGQSILEDPALLEAAERPLPQRLQSRLRDSPEAHGHGVV
mmetsp:Transcript_66833/g.189619  ORF Transcript_66833/g.189619 Transcript_66833/m.189619 type:complete len:284 (-) Transcript_66833:2187-3038(-)